MSKKSDKAVGRRITAISAKTLTNEQCEEIAHKIVDILRKKGAWMENVSVCFNDKVLSTHRPGISPENIELWQDAEPEPLINPEPVLLDWLLESRAKYDSSTPIVIGYSYLAHEYLGKDGAESAIRDEIFKAFDELLTHYKAEGYTNYDFDYADDCEIVLKRTYNMVLRTDGG
ncbi:MAG: hypothetical protein FWD90_09470 [Defluviitaleaceae bacterium]|nr:hypothetical protein [Defluviitaleaceae bacterium]